MFPRKAYTGGEFSVLNTQLKNAIQYNSPSKTNLIVAYSITLFFRDMWTWLSYLKGLHTL